MRGLLGLALALGVGASLCAAAPPEPERVAAFETVRAADLELATIGYRLASSNVGLCQLKDAQFGMPIQAITQFDPDTRDDARAAFGFAAVVAIEAVVPGGPAAQAGLRAGDSLLAIDGVPQPTLAQARDKVDVHDREAAQTALNRGGPSRRRVLRVLRDGVARDVTVVPRPGCRSSLELLVGTGLQALSDGVRVQIGSDYLDRFDANTIAIVVAHEMAHNILHHYDQLRRARTCRVDANETRRTESEADRLSVALLANAGYDPTLPARFWRGAGARLQLFSLSRDHGSASERATTVAATAAALRRNSRGVYYPADFQQMLDRTHDPVC